MQKKDYKKPFVNGEVGWICPKCGASLSPNVTICPKCGEHNDDAENENYEDLESNTQFKNYKPLNS